jgi:Rrf2 family protein
MIFLALNAGKENKIGIKKIADELKIPAPFLAKILQVLAKHKLLASSKGPNGGFALNMHANKITLFEIVTIIDGHDIFDKCLISMRSCHQDNIPCPVHEKAEPMRNGVKKFFQQQDIGHLASDIKAREQVYAL